MKKNGKAREYSMKGGDTPRADLRPMLIDYPIQSGNIDKPLKEFEPIMKGIAKTYKKRAIKPKTRKNRK